MILSSVSRCAHNYKITLILLCSGAVLLQIFSSLRAHGKARLNLSIDQLHLFILSTPSFEEQFYPLMLQIFLSSSYCTVSKDVLLAVGKQCYAG